MQHRPDQPSDAAATPVPLTAAMRWSLASLSLTMLMPSLDTSIANVGLPTLVEHFHTSFAHVQWVVLAYLLAIVTLIVGAGRLGDLVGRRRMLLSGIALFTVASLACGLAPTIGTLIAARAAQGLGAASMMALTLAVVGETVPKHRLGSAMGLLGTMSAIGTAFGPSLGGVMIHAFGWRTIFLINVPIGLANLVLARASLPADGPAERGARHRFDILGTVLLVASLAAYSLAMTLGGGTFGAINRALLASAIAGGVLFVIAQRHAASPLLPLAMFRNVSLSAGLAMSVLVSSVMMSTLVVGPFYLSRALGLDAARVGLVMSVGPLAAALAGVPAGRSLDRFGAARMTTVGLGGMSAGLIALAMLPARVGVIGYLASIVVVTGHYALFQAANNTSVMTSTAPDDRGVVSGMLSMSRNIGLISGTTAMGAVFTLAVATVDIASAPAPAVAAGMRATFLVAAMLVGVALLISLARQAPRAINARAVPSRDARSPG